MIVEGNKYNNKSRVAVITGSSRGIGKAIATEFFKSGYNVVLNSRDEQELKDTTLDIFGGSFNGGGEDDINRISFLAGDVSQEEACISLIEHAIQKFGRLDVLVNNAGILGESKKIHEMSAGEWDEVIDINLRSAFLCTREAVKQMLKNTKTSDVQLNDNNNNYNCSIINMSSYHESVPQAEGVAYTVSKGGMEMLTKTVALELADKGIRVNGVAPGAIETDMQKEVMDDEQKRKHKEIKTPMGRFGKPEEIAKVVLFPASKDASYIAGATVYVDGGRALSS
ncbi:MAG TPA: glucose 1-dehydrogenase [Phototrophicaceae bacterium]|nr:glucose 1-dehydrogenase [Phototrophicaceae bacterium]